MNIRINAGYIITDSIHVGETEFVLGVHSTAPSQFVTWACKNGTDYFWGHYFSDPLLAIPGVQNPVCKSGPALGRQAVPHRLCEG